MLTCCVPLSEFGKIYSVIAATDNLLPMGLSQAYAKVWEVKQLLIAQSRVARFFLVQNTKTGKNIPNFHKLYQMSIKYSKRP
jgi:hypothetical protein